MGLSGLDDSSDRPLRVFSRRQEPAARSTEVSRGARPGKANSVYITSGLENCLYLFLPSQWSQLLEKDLSAFSLPNKEQERAFKRKFFAEATEAELDSAGRILIPQFLREHARLGKNVLVQGAGKRAEIWDKDKWNSYKKSKVEPAYKLVTKSIEI